MLRMVPLPLGFSTVEEQPDRSVSTRQYTDVAVLLHRAAGEGDQPQAGGGGVPRHCPLTRLTLDQPVKENLFPTACA